MIDMTNKNICPIFYLLFWFVLQEKHYFGYLIDNTC